MSTKYTTISVSLCAVTLLVANSLTASELSGNIGAVSNYLWRGVSQTQDSVAIQGGIDYSHDSGFYGGTWLSNLDFGDDTSYELDLYAGLSGNISEDVSYDLSYLYYAYPDANGDINFGEATASISWQWLSLAYSHTLHGDSDIASDPLDSDDMGYWQANVSVPLSETLTLDLHYGYSEGDIVQSWYGIKDYSDYSLSLTKDVQVGSVTLALVDTDLSQTDPKALLSYNYSFDL